MVCKVMEMMWRFCGGGSARLSGHAMSMMGHAGQSFRLVALSGWDPGV